MACGFESHQAHQFEGYYMCDKNCPAKAAIEYALSHKCDDTEAFLKFWYEGDFDAIRIWWQEVPEAVFIGADPSHPLTLPQ